jgi:hypothetical protein
MEWTASGAPGTRIYEITSGSYRQPRVRVETVVEASRDDAGELFR